MRGHVFHTAVPATLPTPRKILLALLCAWGLPCLFGAGLMLVSVGMYPLFPAHEAFWSAFFAMGLFLFLSSLISPLGLLPGALVAQLALRLGWGGWATALLAGLAIGAGIDLTVHGTFSLGSLGGVTLGLLYWSLLRRFSPESFRAEGLTPVSRQTS